MIFARELYRNNLTFRFSFVHIKTKTLSKTNFPFSFFFSSMITKFSRVDFKKFKEEKNSQSLQKLSKLGSFVAKHSKVKQK